MKNQETYVYSEELFNSLKGITIKNIRREMGGVDLDQAGYDYEDLEQECRIWLLEACKQFNPECGMKFHNFYWIKISSKLGNYRNKFQRQQKKGRVRNFTSIGESFWGLVGLESSGEESSGHYSSYMESNHNDNNDVIDSIIEVKKILPLLNPTEKVIYNDFFILGKSLPEIVRTNEFKKNDKPLKYYQIRKIIDDLKGIHSTLVLSEYT